jgi:hypothetical protein
MNERRLICFSTLCSFSFLQLWGLLGETAKTLEQCDSSRISHLEIRPDTLGALPHGSERDAAKSALPFCSEGTLTTLLPLFFCVLRLFLVFFMPLHPLVRCM